MHTAVARGLAVNHEAGFRVERQADGGHRLHVLGRMPIDWVSNLASGLAQNGLSIIRGQVFREGAACWHGHIALKGSSHAVAPENIDYHLLVKSEADKAAMNLALDSFVLRPTAERGGSLFLEIQGKDQLGFLGTFFGRLSFFSLFPVHMEIETTGDHIHDRFWLSAIGGGQPSEPVVAALRRALEKMLTAVS